MRTHTEHLIKICKMPMLGLPDARYETVCAYLDGYNIALAGAPLVGFREWLIVHGNEWTNLPWWGLVRRAVLDDLDVLKQMTDAQNASVLSALVDYLQRFYDFRERYGLSMVYHRYHRWLMARTDEETAYLRERLVEEDNYGQGD